MKEASSIKLLFLFFLAGCLLGTSPLMAQLRLLPLEKPADKSVSRQYRQRTLAEGDSIRLPFWDDFSVSKTVPDTNLWENSQHVAITNTLAVNPPSYNTATFDGIDAFGRPYSQDPNESGASDSLMSRPIRLSSSELPEDAQSSVYMSFYWQLQGRGNRPDSEDSLKMYFYADDSLWYQVWQEGGREAIDSAAFQQEIISLSQAGEALEANFFHDGFRFKLVSENRQSGMYDLWHVDYIFLDRDRSADNIYYQDRSISSLPSSLFYPYTAMPIGQYFANPEKYTRPELSFTAFSFEPPSRSEVMEYSIYTLHNTDTIYKIAENREFGPLLFGQEYFEVSGWSLSPAALDDYRDQDSLYLSTLVVLNSEEERPFFNNNDSARIENVLHDYYAYDDGSAEYGMEIRGSRGVRVAVEFTLEERDTLTHIDLYLPYFSQSISGQFIDLQVWQRIGLGEDGGDSLLYTERDVLLANSEALNQFNSYALRFPQVLQPGSFFVGFEKRSNGFLALGFDRNTDNRDQVYVSTDGLTWFEGQEENGSLMLRARFQQGVDPDVLDSRKPELSYPVQLYPNPSSGKFRVVSEARQLQVYNGRGQLLRSYTQEAGNTETLIDLHEQAPGLYFVKLLFKDAVETRKVLITP